MPHFNIYEGRDYTGHVLFTSYEAPIHLEAAIAGLVVLLGFKPGEHTLEMPTRVSGWGGGNGAWTSGGKTVYVRAVKAPEKVQHHEVGRMIPVAKTGDTMTFKVTGVDPKAGRLEVAPEPPKPPRGLVGGPRAKPKRKTKP